MVATPYSDIRSTLDAYFDGINSERYDRVAELFAPESELRAPGAGVLRGQREVEDYFRAALAPYPKHRDEPTRVLIADRAATVEIHFNGVLASGAAIEFDAVDVFDFDERGRIVRLSSWYDSHAVRSMLRDARTADAVNRPASTGADRPASTPADGPVSTAADRPASTSPPLLDDLLDPRVIDDPHPFFRVLREQDPVHWSERHRAWLLTRYDDCSEALLNFKTLSSDRVRPLLDVMSEEQRAAAGPVYDMITGWMVVTDPPEHRRLRALAAGAFNPRRVAAMEGKIQQLVDQMLDEFIREHHQDLIAHFTYPLPATVISEIIGAPTEDAWRFREWSQALAHVAFGAGGDDRNDRYVRSLRGLNQMFEYIDGLMELRRREPGEDMISALLEGADGDMLSDHEIKSMCALMLFAGHETTTSAIASAVLMLLRHPDQLELLRSDPDGLASTAVEEALRYEGSIKVLHRWVKRDFELRGRRIKEGQRVLVLPAAANRDPERFEDPDRVDITRHPNPHIAFGKGIHACIGAQLARLEMRLALASIVKRLPGLRFADPEPRLRWVPSLASRGLEELRIAHDAG